MDVRLPNGAVIRGVPQTATKDEIKQKAIQLGAAKPEDFAESGIIPSVVGSFKRSVSSGRTALESLTGSAEEAAKAGAARQQEINTAYAPAADLGKVGETYDKEGLWAAAKEAAGQVPGVIAESAPDILATIAAGAAGQALIPIPGVGAVIGAAIPSLITRGGMNIEAQAAAQEAEGKPVDISRTAAFGAAVPQAALDVAANVFPVMGRAAVSKILGPAFEKALAKGTTAELEAVAKQSLLRRAATGVGENLAVQGAIQPAQIMLTRLQAGQDLLSEDAIKEYGQAVYTGALLSPLGAVGGVRGRGAARSKIAQKNEALDTAKDTLFSKVAEEKLADPEAPERSMGAVSIQRMLGIKLPEAAALRRELIDRGDLIRAPDTTKRGFYLNPERAPVTEADLLGTITERPPEEAPVTTPERASVTEADLLGALTERPPEEATVTIPGAEEPVVRQKMTAPESPVYQNALTLVQSMHEAGTPITFQTFRETAKDLGLKPIHINPILNAFTRDGILSKPDENKVRTFNKEAVEGVKPYESSVREVPSDITTGTPEPDLTATGRGVVPPISGDGTEVRAPEGGVPGRVGDIREPVTLAATPERAGEPALGERVPYSAQPISPEVFTPAPEQARISTEAIETGLMPGRGIERAKRMQERQKEEAPVPPPEEGVSVKSAPVAESLRAGNLGEALYRLKDETSGKSPLSWLADKLLNVVEVKDDRTPLIKAEVDRIAREQGIDKREAPEDHAKMAQEVERAIMSDVDLTKYDFKDTEGRLTKAGELRESFKPQVERMVPIEKGRAQYNRDTGKLEFIKPAPEPKKPENLYRPYVLETPEVKSPFKKAFGGAKVFVEGNANLKGQNKAVIERLKRENKLAEYSPKTNAFYFTEAGLTDRVILHEMVHSATVDVMRKYLSGKVGELTAVQREAAADIMAIYKSTKQSLGDKFKAAYENPYEFVSYAMTHESFQRALSNQYAPRTAKVKLRSAWDSFTLAVAKMLGLDKSGRLKAMETPSPTRVLKPSEGIKRILEKERAEGVDTLDNALLQVLESVGDILTVPKAGVDVRPLAARGNQRRRIRVPKNTKAASTQRNGSTTDVFNAVPSKSFRAVSFAKNLFTNKGHEDLLFKVQDYQRGWLKQEEALNRGKLLKRDGEFNDTHERMTLAPQKQENIILRNVTPLINDLQGALTGYAKKTGRTVKDAVEHLGVLRMAMNEQEKRFQKYLETVALRDDIRLSLGNKPVTPAEYRDAIFMHFAKNKNLLSDAQVKAFKTQLESLVKQYVKPGAEPIDSPKYQVVGYHPTDLKMWRRAYAQEMRTNAAEIKKVFDAYDRINEEKIALERQGKYWTNQVDNLRKLYDYKFYAPFKGMDKVDLGYELDTNARAGSQYKQVAEKAEGRRTGIDNPIFQAIYDLNKAAERAAQDGITQSVVNQIKAGDLAGKPEDSFSFDERYNGVSKKDMTGKNVFFHHVGDGTVEVYSLKDSNLIEGLNGLNNTLSFKAEILNPITRFMGRGHTFYSVKFAPINFVRDVLTNAYNASGKFGVTMAPKIIGNVAKTIMTSFGGAKAAKISWLYQKNDLNAIKNMQGQFAKDAYEFLIEQGGKSSYQKSLSIENVREATIPDDSTLSKRLVGRGKWLKEGVDTVFTTWADTFEFISRVATYTTVKKELISRAKAEGKAIGSPVVMNGIKQEAAAFSKNLFNYEKVGKYGRELGALYMFMRPSLTSAVRVADLLQPLMPGESAEKAISRGPKSMQITDKADPNFARSEKAREEFTKQYNEEKKNAAILVGLLAGAGAGMYTAALMAAGEDDENNLVATDDMTMWVRGIRWPKKFAGEGNEFFQMPWGFGGGGIAAMGAQLAALAAGNQKAGSMMENMIPIMLDSFLPLPVPRFSPIENPGAFALDSLFPSALRPGVEFMLNIDGIGRQIYNDRSSKYGDAYSGGQYVPKWARDFTAYIAKKTADWEEPLIMSPNIIAYFASNYFDAIGQGVSAIYSTLDADKGEFNVKKDVPLVGGFIGTKVNAEAQKFSEVSKEVESMIENIATYSDRPEFETYLLSHPEEVSIVELYQSTINGRLKELQSEEKAISAGIGFYAELPEKNKQAALKDIGIEKKYIMGNFVQSYNVLKDQQD